MTARRKPTTSRSRTTTRQKPPQPRTRARSPRPDSEPVPSRRAPQRPVLATTAPAAEHRSPGDTVARLCGLVLSLLDSTGAVANTPEVQRLRDDIRAEICAIEGSTYEPR